MADDWNFSLPWYHGSPFELTVLHVGSSITQDLDVARIFSHKPTLMGGPHGDVRFKHNGAMDGYLYCVAETVIEEDVVPHPHPVNRDKWEWLIQREMRVELIERTHPRDEEHYTDAEIAEIRRMQAQSGQESFITEANDRR
jgi:hypothetical protein